MIYKILIKLIYLQVLIDKKMHYLIKIIFLVIIKFYFLKTNIYFIKYTQKLIKYIIIKKNYFE